MVNNIDKPLTIKNQEILGTIIFICVGIKRYSKYLGLSFRSIYGMNEESCQYIHNMISVFEALDLKEKSCWGPNSDYSNASEIADAPEIAENKQEDEENEEDFIAESEKQDEESRPIDEEELLSENEQTTAHEENESEKWEAINDKLEKAIRPFYDMENPFFHYNEVITNLNASKQGDKEYSVILP